MSKRALIVDDFPFDVELTRLVLDSCNDRFEVVVVGDGEEALHKLNQAEDFDVILLDLKLPKVDGFEVLKEISRTPFLSDVPVIVMSSTRDQSDRIRTRAMGAREFVEKCLDYSMFKVNLTRSLSQHGFHC
jgi:CheY-like chemotaxis protein